jgi:hypothetical protein
MKIFHRSFLAVIVAMLFFTSCRKDENVTIPVKKADVSTANARLVFKDRSTFESYSTSLGNIPKDMSVQTYLRNAESKLNFSSMRAVDQDALINVPNARIMKEAGIEDDYLASMLNPKGIVQIGEWIIKVDVPNKKVYALNEKDENLINDLEKDIPSHEKIRLFSTDDEVLVMLEEGEMGKSARVSILCFKENGAERREDYDTPHMATDNNYRLDCKLIYQKAGIYFSIQAKAQFQKEVAGVLFSTIGYVLGSYGGEYKVKCRDWGYPSGSGSNNYGNGGEDGSSWSVRLYESSLALNRYKATATFQASNDIGSMLSKNLYIEYGY